MRRVLVPGGRVAAIVYSTPENNRFFSLPVSIIRRRANLGPPLPGQPGPFSLGAPGVLAAAYERAGFRDVAVEVAPGAAPHGGRRRLRALRAASRSARSTRCWAASTRAGRKAAWDEIATALGEFEGPERIRRPLRAGAGGRDEVDVRLVGPGAGDPAGEGVANAS